jgi:hypothetical protein
MVNDGLVADAPVELPGAMDLGMALFFWRLQPGPEGSGRLTWYLTS